VLVITIIYIRLRRDSESSGNDVTRRWKVSAALTFFYCFGRSSIAESLRADSLLVCSIGNEFLIIAITVSLFPFGIFGHRLTSTRLPKLNLGGGSW
jgi:hypothetical protein